MSNDFQTPDLGSGSSTTAYLSSSAALALAATLPPAMLVAFLASANAAYLDGALLLASDRIDSLRYQGRKADPAQAREFPRLARESGSNLNLVGVDYATIIAPFTTRTVAEIWDWDAANQVAIVPPKVLMACLFEANSILDGQRDQLINAQRDGLARQDVGGMEEIYREGATKEWGMKLCAVARDYLFEYRMKSGQIR
jgi:hypothetical protein